MMNIDGGLNIQSGDGGAQWEWRQERFVVRGEIQLLEKNGRGDASRRREGQT
jgi:hypothetical protein